MVEHVTLLARVATPKVVTSYATLVLSIPQRAQHLVVAQPLSPPQQLKVLRSQIAMLRNRLVVVQVVRSQIATLRNRLVAVQQPQQPQQPPRLGV